MCFCTSHVVRSKLTRIFGLTEIYFPLRILKKQVTTHSKECIRDVKGGFVGYYIQQVLVYHSSLFLSWICQSSLFVLAFKGKVVKQSFPPPSFKFLKQNSLTYVAVIVVLPCIYSLRSTVVLKQIILLLSYHQKVSSLALPRNACIVHLTHHVGILSSHVIRRR